MLQNPCKTSGFKKNMVYKIPPGGGGKPYPASGLCSIGIYNMTTIVAILISFKDHLFPSLRQIESKLGLRDRGNMDIQNCLNHSILISNLAPMATILIFFQKA